jgi:hypothetical protein
MFATARTDFSYTIPIISLRLSDADDWVDNNRLPRRCRIWVADASQLTGVLAKPWVLVNVDLPSGLRTQATAQLHENNLLEIVGTDSTTPGGGNDGGPSNPSATIVIIPSGTTAQRPTPDVGSAYVDTDLGKVLIIADGATWRDAMGQPVTNAARNMRAVVNSDNSITLSWDAKSGAASYKLYEDQSLTGVAGADALTVTTTTRTPSTMRTYHYWVTALVAGVESDPTNKAEAILPYVSPGGVVTPPGGGPPPPPTGNTPAEVLNINGKGAANGGWWNEGIGFHSGDAEGSNHVDITVAQLVGGYTRAFYFERAQANTAVKLGVYCDGGKTSTNTHYPRSELREYNSDGTTKAAWDAASGTHLLSGVTRVTHGTSTKDEVCIAQIHNASDDNLQLRVEGGNVMLSIQGVKQSSPLLTGYVKGTDIAWEVKVVSGTVTVKINGVQKYSGHPGYGTGSYFKVGCYAQAASGYTSGVSATDYFSVELKSLLCSHS